MSVVATPAPAAADKSWRNIRFEVLEKLERRKATSLEIAPSMAMSRSTFKRRLADQGFTFRRIRDEVIQQVAARTLVDTNTKLSRES